MQDWGRQKEGRPQVGAGEKRRRARPDLQDDARAFARHKIVNAAPAACALAFGAQPSSPDATTNQASPCYPASGWGLSNAPKPTSARGGGGGQLVAGGDVRVDPKLCRSQPWAYGGSEPSGLSSGRPTGAASEREPRGCFWPWGHPGHLLEHLDERGASPAPPPPVRLGRRCVATAAMTVLPPV